jgi:hypothetical protein
MVRIWGEIKTLSLNEVTVIEIVDAIGDDNRETNIIPKKK